MKTYACFYRDDFGFPCSASASSKEDPDGDWVRVEDARELERQLAETRRAWQGCREEFTELRRELVEARAALEDVAKNQPSAYDHYNHRKIWDQRAWMEKHAATLKAVMEDRS